MGAVVATGSSGRWVQPKVSPASVEATSTGPVPAVMTTLVRAGYSPSLPGTVPGQMRFRDPRTAMAVPKSRKAP